jgi:signal transduction histidine kinase
MRSLFAGIGWQGVALVMIMSFINALRRNVFGLVHDDALVAIAGFADAMATGLLIGFIMLIAVAVALRRYPARGARQCAAIAAAIVVASGLGALAKAAWSALLPLEAEHYRALGWTTYVLRDWLRYVVIGALIAGAYLYLCAEAETTATARECDIDAQRMAREVAEARLRVMEAQIEPHFLFNTLASVKRLYREGGTAGPRMLDNLMRYLSVTLPQMRSPERTLGGEAALATAYLDIQRMRMGRRLSCELAIPDALRESRFPPFMLLTLVENAVKHGLDPLPEGGAVHVAATARDGRLIVEVRDTGQGFVEGSGAGTGLAGIRARLRLLHGDRAELDMHVNEPRGVVATLVMPFEDARPGQGQ